MNPKAWEVPDLAARWAIMLSHLYYDRNESLVTDETFDRLCEYIANNWYKLEPIRQWQLESPEAIRASGHHIKLTQIGLACIERIWREKYPRRPLNAYKFEPHPDGPHPEFKCLYTTLKG